MFSQSQSQNKSESNRSKGLSKFPAHQSHVSPLSSNNLNKNYSSYLKDYLIKKKNRYFRISPSAANLVFNSTYIDKVGLLKKLVKSKSFYLFCAGSYYFVFAGDQQSLLKDIYHNGLPKEAKSALKYNEWANKYHLSYVRSALIWCMNPLQKHVDFTKDKIWNFENALDVSKSILNPFPFRFPIPSKKDVFQNIQWKESIKWILYLGSSTTREKKMLMSKMLGISENSQTVKNIGKILDDVNGQVLKMGGPVSIAFTASFMIPLNPYMVGLAFAHNVALGSAMHLKYLTGILQTVERDYPKTFESVRNQRDQWLNSKYEQFKEGQMQAIENIGSTKPAGDFPSF